VVTGRKFGATVTEKAMRRENPKREWSIDRALKMFYQKRSTFMWKKALKIEKALSEIPRQS